MHESQSSWSWTTVGPNLGGVQLIAKPHPRRTPMPHSLRIDDAEVQVLLGAVAREHLPDRADVAVVGGDEALARAPIHLGWRGLG